MAERFNLGFISRTQITRIDFKSTPTVFRSLFSVSKTSAFEVLLNFLFCLEILSSQIKLGEIPR